MSTQTQTIVIRDLDKEDIVIATTILTQAFAQDPVMQWICGDRYPQVAPALFEAITRYCMLYGKAFCTSKMESVALRKLPFDTKFSWWKAFRAGYLALPKRMGNEAFKRLMLFDDLTQKERKKQMGNNSYWYCWCLATRPEKQGKGFGTALIQHTFNLAAETGFPCYLETAVRKNQTLYEKNGYVKVSEFNLPDSEVVIISMLRE
ncbi:Acetyltransferase (GNAT) family [Legionella lansingensis]|uniref:Acetyltransferase (GNAT) family protein n=1 Tax=Legionella lansingensis TaxID=45067 RepID=A0A0W0VRK7_9GAMM|nr:GNAT family N-acetyltransferase [Legionella lansingensis]KTD22766.1 Acetyltransferase (GNAT) family protein [Legionella lansingensis]SNV57047.1 Acetyltransferase (GNAT) family [Legionella lansingensis]